MTKILKKKGMPCYETVCRWLRKGENEEFSEMYARAREDQADNMADQIVEISDNEEEDPQRSRLKIDARKWVASKLKPKRYGDKIQHSGDADNPVQVVITGDDANL